MELKEGTNPINQIETHRKNKWVSLNKFYQNISGTSTELKMFDQERSKTKPDEALASMLLHDQNELLTKVKQREAKEAIKMKDIGNKYLGKGEIKQALEFYSKAISYDYNNKYLWTNRALAYIKNGEHASAVVDCTVVLDLLEIEGLCDGNKGAYCKALMRRATALNAIGESKNALKDINKCEETMGEEESVTKLKQEILDSIKKNEVTEEKAQGDCSHDHNHEDAHKDHDHHDHDHDHKHVKQEQVIIPDDAKELIDQFVNKFEGISEDKLVTDYDYFDLGKLLEKGDKASKGYFLSKGGISIIDSIIRLNSFELLNLEVEKKRLYFINFCHIMLTNNLDFMSILYDNGLLKFLMRQTLLKLMKLSESQNPAYDKLLIEEYTELMVLMSSNSNCGRYMVSNSHIFIKMFDYFYLLFPQFQEDYSLLSSLLTFFSNLFIFNSTPKRPNMLLTYVSDTYLKQIFMSFALFLKPESTIYLSFKKSVLAFLSNYLISPNVRNFCIAKIMGCSTLNNKGIMDNDDREGNPALFLFENLIIDGIRTLKNSVEKHKKFGQNTRRYFECLSGIFMNILHGYNDKRVVIAFLRVFNDKNISVLTLQLLNSFIKIGASQGLPSFEQNLGRLVSFCARFYTMKFEGKDKELILDNIRLLAGFFNSSKKENIALDSEICKFFVAILQLDSELKKDVFEILKEKDHLIAFHIKVIRDGPDPEKVR